MRVHVRVFLCCWAWCVFLVGMASVEAHESWTTSRLVGSPDPPPPYRVELAFPNLRFERPLDITSAPGADRLFVVEHGGKIYSFRNHADCRQLDLVIDLRETYPDLSAVYGLTFHPDFARNRLAYVCYVRGNDKPDGTFVSRLEMSRTNPPRLEPSSEQILIRWWAGGHNGGCLKFGPDGFLYISTGDGGAPSPPDPLKAGQDVSNLLSAILRIDVDHTDGPLPYSVPRDNPLREFPEARPEIWSYGFRNPWKMSFDRESGDLWVGDVGWQLWEMIYRVQRGGNYGWAIMEGPQPALPELKPGPTPILPPAVSHPHSEAASITGGFVYHGERLPELRGAYIYGDYQSGKVWGLRHDGQQTTWHEELAQTPLQLVAFGEDLAGELFLLDYERTQQIYRLARSESSGDQAAFPRRLSETGLFSSVADQTPAAGVIGYDINAHHWADHAVSERWLAVPGTAPVQVDADGGWRFPDGSVLAKTVSIEMRAGSPFTLRRLETQVLLRDQERWRPYTYIWNEDQTDAELAPASGADCVLQIDDPSAPGGRREQTYRVASRAECQLCHNPWVDKQTTMYGVQSASPLAVSIGQWNRLVGDGGEQTNQLVALVQDGWLRGALPDDPRAALQYVDPYDETADLNDRVRSYLQVNCAHCHQPHAGGAATIDLSYDVPWDQAQLLGVRPQQGAFGISDVSIVSPGDPLGSVLYYRLTKAGAGRMPRLGSSEIDRRGVALIHDWIVGLSSPTPDHGSLAARLRDADSLAALDDDSAAVRAEAVAQLTSSTRGALALLRRLDRGELSPESARQVAAIASTHAQAEIRDLFDRFVPPAERTKRLGSVVDAAELLSLPADAERGRQVFFQQGGAASCKSCHRVRGEGETLGPDLSQIGKKYPPHELLTHVLDPSRFIDPQYVPYLLETVDGRVLSGLLVERTAQDVLLRTGENKELRVPTVEIEMLVTQPKSLMPDLLLRDLTPQQAADLLAYLSSLR